MAEKSAFKPENITASSTKKGELLDDLNLPPWLTFFLRTNARKLLIAAICLVASLLAWNFYGQHREKHQDAASALLAKAMAEPAAQRKAILEEVAREYPGTGAARWSELEQAHMAAEAGNWPEAIQGYEDVLAALGKADPLAPLVQLSLARAFEESKNYPKAVEAYQKLAAVTGFVAEGYLGLARVYTSEGDAAKAKEMYEKVLALENVPALVRQSAEQELGRL